MSTSVDTSPDTAQRAVSVRIPATQPYAAPKARGRLPLWEKLVHRAAAGAVAVSLALVFGPPGLGLGDQSASGADKSAGSADSPAQDPTSAGAQMQLSMAAVDEKILAGKVHVVENQSVLIGVRWDPIDHNFHAAALVPAAPDFLPDVMAVSAADEPGEKAPQHGQYAKAVMVGGQPFSLILSEDWVWTSGHAVSAAVDIAAQTLTSDQLHVDDLGFDNSASQAADLTKELDSLRSVAAANRIVGAHASLVDGAPVLVGLRYIEDPTQPTRVQAVAVVPRHSVKSIPQAGVVINNTNGDNTATSKFTLLPDVVQTKSGARFDVYASDLSMPREPNNEFSANLGIGSKQVASASVPVYSVIDRAPVVVPPLPGGR